MYMEIDILNSTSYFLMFGQSKNLIGTQTIYSTELQIYLIKSFLDSDEINQVFMPENMSEDLRKYSFCVNNIALHPTLTCALCPKNYIFVSDEIYEQYFKSNNTNLQLNFYYEIPKIQDIKLKRINGNFPRDDSLEPLLTYYFESCMIINKGQKFKIYYDDDFIEFEIFSLKYFSEPQRNLQDRFDEINITIKLNQYLTNEPNIKLGLNECKSQVLNYNWYYNTNNKNSLIGDVSFHDVNVDFEETIPPKPEIILPKKEQSQEQLICKDEQLICEDEHLTREEIRQKRLAFFDKNKFPI